MKHYLTALLLLPLLAADCNKDNGPDTPAENYLPGGTNSTWTYDTRNITAGTTGSYTLTRTSRDTTVSGRTYRVYSNSNGPSFYYSVAGSDYYQYANFPGTDQQIELLYLKAGAAAGTNWQQNVALTIPGLGSFSTSLTNRIEEKGISYTVGTRSFTDVVRVKTTIGAITIPGVPIPITPTSDINTYYANNVGRIFNKTIVNISIPTVPAIAVNEETSIRSFTIVP
ncbi:MAG: hypothetical protein MUF62_08380 [Chitinophagaceae bacterium]|jgi:hypothetical protein|nr:hypothetical protein [Chitinophagaceae bacterium]